jgi:hypothetical protein
MKNYSDLTKEELQNLLIRCWMTHDAMWLYHSIQTIGIEKANLINKAAVRNMAQVEAKRITKILGISTIKNFNDLTDFLDNLYMILKGDFMKFEYSFPEKNKLHWEVKQCFAYEGIKSMGLIDKYECGIFERILGWFEYLGLHHKMEPEVKECLLSKFGKCSVDFIFNFQ